MSWQRPGVRAAAILTKVLPLAAIAALAGCGNSAEDKLYEGFKCSRVASQLGSSTAAANAMENVREYALDLDKSVPPDQRARHAMRATERFQDDVPLHKLSNQGKRELLTSIYQSSTCQELYVDKSMTNWRTPRDK